MARSTLIAAEAIGACARWQFATVGADGVAQGGIADPEALQDAYRQGHAAGVAAGRAEALAQARAEFDDYLAGQGREAARRFAQLFSAAEAGLAEAQQDIARGTLEIACAIARRVLRHELATRPEALESVVREALGLLLADGKSASVRLAPADFELLDAPLRAEFGGAAVHLVADAAIAPGDCLVEAAGTVVDARLATRWSRAVASLGLEMPWLDEEPAHAA